jgi:hypothetical protein
VGRCFSSKPKVKLEEKVNKLCPLKGLRAIHRYHPTLLLSLHTPTNRILLILGLENNALLLQTTMRTVNLGLSHGNPTL